MSVQHYEFWECTSSGCQFRFPALTPDKQKYFCPLCGSDTKLASQASFVPENQLPGSAYKHRIFEVLLDNIRSTWNVGSMLRTADGAGITRMYLCGITPTPDHPKTKRTSLGAEQSIQWSWHPNSVILAQELINTGKHLWALEEGSDTYSIYAPPQPPPDTPVVLIIGNEVTGIDPDLLKLCEQTLSIPMLGVKRSLNAAVAFGIGVYTLLSHITKPASDVS